MCCLDFNFIPMPVTSTSYSEHSEFPAEDSYLINTEKIVKGHKLTLKDTIRKQIMKSRGISRTNHKQPAPQPNPSDRITQYTEKYHALETIEDEQQMLRFIFYKRFKQSRASERGIKLFSRQTNRPKTTQDPASTRFVTARMAKSSQTKRSLERSGKYKSLEYEVHNSRNESLKSNVQFSSDNIDSRMTEYLNLVLQVKEKDEMEITQQELRDVSQGVTQGEDMLSKIMEIKKSRQKSNNTFLRQMRKHQNQKVKKDRSGQKTCGSDQLVKSLKRKTQPAWQKSDKDTHHYSTLKAFSKYSSIELDEQPFYNAKLSKDRKFEKSYLSTIVPKMFENQSKGVKTAITSARREIY